MSRLDRFTSLGARAGFFLFCALALPYANAQVAPPLGQAGSFSVLGSSTVTNTGPTSVLGDLGVSPGSAIVGFPPGTITGGTIHANDAVAVGARADATTAYNTLAGEASNVALTGQDLGGKTLVSGVYTFSSSAQLTGTLTLDAQNNPAAVFVFQIGSSLTTASGSRVVVINGGTDCNVFWQVGSSATLGTTTQLVGNILALTSITLNTGATLSGRALALNGAVTLDSNNVSICGTCGVLALAPATLAPIIVGTPYAQTITATGGTAPYSYTVIDGALPPGISLTGTGALSGTPTTDGIFIFTIRATDAAGCVGDLTYTMVVNPVLCGTITMAPLTIPDPIVGTPYLQLMSASGGTAPYAFVVSSGLLPQGMILGSDGALGGTPSTEGGFFFTVTATDADGCAVAQNYQVEVQPSALVCSAFSVTPATLGPLDVGVPFSQTINASGATEPYTFVVESGQLPPGLALAAASPTSATISGTPSANDGYSFTLLVTDGDGCTQRVAYQGSVIGPVTAVSAPALSLWSELALLLAVAAVAAWSVGRMRRPLG